jgi:hypothetical protein
MNSKEHHKSRRDYFWLILFALNFLCFQSISDYFRPRLGYDIGWLRYFFGIAPNFFSAFGMPCLFLVLIPHMVNEDSLKRITNAQHWIAVSISTAGLVIWEFMQLSGKLHFDYHDILWTLIGSGCFLLIYRIKMHKAS